MYNCDLNFSDDAFHLEYRTAEKASLIGTAPKIDNDHQIGNPSQWKEMLEALGITRAEYEEYVRL